MDKIKGNYNWINYEAIYYSSKEYNTKILDYYNKKDSLKPYESEKLGNFPIEIIIRLNNRTELDYIIIKSLDKLFIQDLEIYITDSNNYMDSKYYLSGKHDYIQNTNQQIICRGIGSFLKLVSRKKPKRTRDNPFSQISIESLKIYGRITHVLPNMDYLVLEKDKTRMNKILLTLGMKIVDFNSDNIIKLGTEVNNVDSITKILLNFLSKKKEEYLITEDFEGFKTISIDFKSIVEIGKTIFRLQKQLEIEIAKNNLENAIILRDKIKDLMHKRDNYEAIYETDRFNQIIKIKKPLTPDYNKRLLNDESYKNQLLKEQERRNNIKLERSKLHKSGYRDDEEELNKTVNNTINNKSLNKSILQKSKYLDFDKTKLDVVYEEYEENEGDFELKNYFEPLMKDIKNRNDSKVSLDLLSKLKDLGLLNIFGKNVWSASYSENWQIREAASQAVYKYLNDPILEKFKNNSKMLFLAGVEFARIIFDDKLLQIYTIGLKILNICLKVPICGADIDSNLLNKILKEMSPIIIKKISQLNQKARDISLSYLISYYKHPSAKIQDLVHSILDVCEKEKDIVLYNLKTVPIEKQQSRIIFARLLILSNIIEEFGVEDYDWQEPFFLLVIPSLYHHDKEIREISISISLKFQQLIGNYIREEIANLNDLNPYLKEELLVKIEEIREEKKRVLSSNYTKNDKRNNLTSNYTNMSNLHEIKEEKEDINKDEEEIIDDNNEKNSKKGEIIEDNTEEIVENSKENSKENSNIN